MGTSDNHNLQFFTVFLPQRSSHRMMIPNAFAKKIAEAIPGRVFIKNRSKSWLVYVDKNDGRLYFDGGWPRFVLDNSLSYGEFLVFEYNGHHIFNVIILGRNGCEKDCVEAEEADEVKAFSGIQRRDNRETVSISKRRTPSPMPCVPSQKNRICPLEEEQAEEFDDDNVVSDDDDGDVIVDDDDDDNDDDDDDDYEEDEEISNTKSRKVASKKNSLVRKHNADCNEDKHKDDDVHSRESRKVVSGKDGLYSITKEEERRIRRYLPKNNNPYFVVKKRKSAIKNNRLMLPKGFINSHLNLSNTIHLQDAKGTTWKGKKCVWDNGQTWLAGGWKHLCKSNKVSYDDIIIGEFLPQYKRTTIKFQIIKPSG